MTFRRRDLARRFVGAGVTAIVLAGVVAGPVGAAKPVASGPSVTNLVVDSSCRVSMTYSAKGGKQGEVDLYAQTLGYTSPTDTTLGYDIWAGSTWQPAAMVNGSANVVFQLAPGGRQKRFTYYGWLYGKAPGVYKDGTLSAVLHLPVDLRHARLRVHRQVPRRLHLGRRRLPPGTPADAEVRRAHRRADTTDPARLRLRRLVGLRLRVPRPQPDCPPGTSAPTGCATTIRWSWSPSGRLHARAGGACIPG